jgi:hypothetical protein
MVKMVDINDIDTIRKIHNLYFKDEFSLEDFFDPHTLRAYTVFDDDRNIICVGGVKTITEAIMVTNKAFSPDVRREAFLQMLETMIHTCGEFDYNQLHAFIQDDNWLRHLKSVGFKDTKGKSLVLCL